MEKLAFLLSGEHPEIPASEISAILEAEGVEFKPLQKLDQLLIIEAPPRALEAVGGRASMCMSCGRLIFTCRANYGEIMSEAEQADLHFLQGKSFAVRVKRVKLSAPEISTAKVQEGLGALFLKNTSAKVKLRNPEIVLQGVITQNSFALYLMDCTIDRGAFDQRRPRTRPFFHPGALSPRISRALVNLARARRGGIFIDPFCGTGGFLIEASLIGCEVVGLDVDRRMVQGARLNLNFYDIKPLALMRGDARALPFVEIESCATDPPYGRAASSKGILVEKLYLDFLRGAGDVARGYVCLAYPHWVNIERIAIECGFKLREKFSMYVHKSLTRKIATLKR